MFAVAAQNEKNMINRIVDNIIGQMPCIFAEFDKRFLYIYKRLPLTH